MFNQHKIHRVFRLINFLRAQPPKTLRGVAAFLDTSERTVYRYVDMLNDLGFEVHKDNNGKLFIPAPGDQNGSGFTEEESAYLKQLLHAAGGQHVLSQSILAKIEGNGDLRKGTEAAFRVHVARNIELLNLAIAQKCQVKLINYYSANSQTVTDRLIEPVAFTADYSMLSAYEPAAEQNKYFSVERISAVELLDTQCMYTHNHIFYAPDVFGFQGEALNKLVEFEMSLRAYLIFKDEYPAAAELAEPIPGTDKYRFSARVQSFKAPGRFVMGLKGEIKVFGSREFEGYLRAAGK